MSPSLMDTLSVCVLLTAATNNEHSNFNFDKTPNCSSNVLCAKEDYLIICKENKVNQLQTQITPRTHSLQTDDWSFFSCAAGSEKNPVFFCIYVYDVPCMKCIRGSVYIGILLTFKIVVYQKRKSLCLHYLLIHFSLLCGCVDESVSQCLQMKQTRIIDLPPVWTVLRVCCCSVTSDTLLFVSQLSTAAESLSVMSCSHNKSQSFLSVCVSSISCDK